MARTSPSQLNGARCRVLRVGAVAAAFAALAVGCASSDALTADSGPGESLESQAPRAGEKAQAGTCTVEVAEDANTTWAGQSGPSAAFSSWWLDEQQLVSAADELGGDAKLAQQLVDSGMFLAPPLALFCFESASRGSGLTIGAVDGLAKADFPYGPGTYAVSTDKDGNPTNNTLFYVGLNVDNAQQRPVPNVNGTLAITKLDGTGITATFEANTPGQPEENGKLAISAFFDFGR